MRVIFAILSMCVFGASASAMDVDARFGSNTLEALPVRSLRLEVSAGGGYAPLPRVAALNNTCPETGRPAKQNARSSLPPVQPRMICVRSEEEGWALTRETLFSLALAAATDEAVAPPAKAANPETPWGTPSASAKCVKAVSPILSIQGRSATIRGAEGHLSVLGVTADIPGVQCNASEEVKLSVPLSKPLLLGTSPVLIILAYHAEDRQGWAKGRLAAQVNDGNLFFDRLGSDGVPGEIRIPISPAAIVMANGLNIRVLLQGEAQLGGSEFVVLDAVTIHGE